MLHVEDVLGEVWRDQNDFVAGVKHRLEHDIDRASGAHGHDDVIGFELDTGFGTQSLSNGGTCLGETRIRHVSVESGVALASDLLQSPIELRRWRKQGITQRQVKHIFGTVDPSQFRAFFKHASDP